MPNVEKLKSGNWRAKVYLGRENGKIKFASVTAKTKKEAELKALLFESSKDDMTFLEASERYILSKSNTLSPNTLRSYRILQKRLSSIDSVPIDKLTKERIQRLVNDLSADLSPKSVKSTYGFFTAVMNMFTDYKTSVTLPVMIRKKTPIPTKEELSLMIQKAHSKELSIAIELAAFGSLRSGEICAITKKDIHGDHISITKTLALDENGKYVVKNSPKSYAGFRDVPLPDDLMQRLKELFNEGGFHYTPNSLNSAFRRLIKYNHLPHYRFHSLRHFFASFCHAKGIPDQYIMKIGGWDDVGTLTKIYQSTMDEEMEEAVKKISNFYDDVKNVSTKVSTDD